MVKTAKELKVGDTIWILDRNRRKYDGKTLIWWHCWAPCTITGETSRSFVVNAGAKHNYGFMIPKNGSRAEKLPFACSEYALSVEEIEHFALIDRANEIAHRIIACRDYDLLAAAAEAVGFPLPRATADLKLEPYKPQSGPRLE